jgi:hypothetical protein
MMACGATHLSIQVSYYNLSQEQSGQIVKPETYLHLEQT